MTARKLTGLTLISVPVLALAWLVYFAAGVDGLLEFGLALGVIGMLATGVWMLTRP